MKIAKKDDKICPNERLLWASRVGDMIALKEALANGADVNARADVGRWTALMGAATHKGSEIVEYLIATGADVNAKNDNGTTALMDAVWGHCANCVKMLIAAGADVNTVNSEGKTSLMMAAHNKKPDIIVMLAEARADIECIKDEHPYVYSVIKPVADKIKLKDNIKNTKFKDVSGSIGL